MDFLHLWSLGDETLVNIPGPTKGPSVVPPVGVVVDLETGKPCDGVMSDGGITAVVRPEHEVVLALYVPGGWIEKGSKAEMIDFCQRLRTEPPADADDERWQTMIDSAKAEIEKFSPTKNLNLLVVKLNPSHDKCETLAIPRGLPDEDENEDV